jgi:hypothetical protein
VAISTLRSKFFVKKKKTNALEQLAVLSVIQFVSPSTKIARESSLISRCYALIIITYSSRGEFTVLYFLSQCVGDHNARDNLVHAPR